MKTEIEFKIECDKNILNNMHDKYLLNYEENNPIFLNILKEGKIKIKMNLKRKKNKIFIKSLFSFLNDLSISIEDSFYLILSQPIYVEKKQSNIPVDWNENKFYFNNGFVSNNIITITPEKLIFKDINFYKSLKRISKNVIEKAFYDCNLPEEKEGYQLIELSEDIYKYKKIYNEQNINKIINNKHRTHYLKWKYNEDISIRYFITFEDKKEYEGKFFIKSHNEKEYILLTKKQAHIMINQLKCETPEEIIGVMKDNKYHKHSFKHNE
jgi:hypothetical protein